MSDEELRREAVRRRLAAEGPEQIGALGRSGRWVRKRVARHQDDEPDVWAKTRSRAPHVSPRRTPEERERQILAARERLVANPRAQYGALAIAGELRRLGVDPIPPSRTIERVLARSGLSRPRRRVPGYVAKGVTYPALVMTRPGNTHQINLVGPRHLYGGVSFHALNLIDTGSHVVASDILEVVRPPSVAASIAAMWSQVGVPTVAQFDNHANFRGAIQPAVEHFRPVVATCLNLGVVPRRHRSRSGQASPGADSPAPESPRCATSPR